MHEEDALEKLRLDRQQWRLSAEVIGAETQDFTSTITGVSCNPMVDACLFIFHIQVLILDEHQIKKRDGHIKLLQKALMINLAYAWRECSEQGCLYSLLSSCP